MPASRAADGDMLESLLELEDDHQIQRALSRDLEAIADALPEAPSPAQVRRIAERIERVSTEHYAHTRTVLASLPGAFRPSDRELATLESMHSNDASHGQDLVSALWDHVERSPSRQGPGRQDGQLGYMLRCYFDGLRRAMAFEEALIARATRILRNPELNADAPPPAASRD